MTTMVDPIRLIGGRYVLEKCIGEGGTGEVWRARHVTLRSSVAIKLLHGSAAVRESTRKRFLTEARLAAQLSTRHAVKVFDFGVTDHGRPYLVMELLDGETLADRLEREKMLTPYATARILRLASRALDAAHALGVVHRDFKPENIFLVRNEEEEEDVKVVDFGVAKLMGELNPDGEDSGLISSRLTEKFTSFTQTGRSVGPPVYWAPEQTLPGKEVGSAADIWAIGVVAYECLTGHRPFVAHDSLSLFETIRQCKCVSARERNAALPDGFDDWFHRACEPDPARRFPDASAATTALIEALGIQSSTIALGDSGASHPLLPRVRAQSPPSAVVLPVRRGSELSVTPQPLSKTPPAQRRRTGLREGIFAFAMGAVLMLSAGTWWHVRSVSVPPVSSAVVETTGTVSTGPVERPAVAASVVSSAGMVPLPSASEQSEPEEDAGRQRSVPVAVAAPSKRTNNDRHLPSARPPATQPPLPKGTPTKPPAKGLPTKQPPDEVTEPSSPFALPELGL